MIFRFLWVPKFSSVNSDFMSELDITLNGQLQKLNLLGLETQFCNPSYSGGLGQKGHSPEVCLHYKVSTGQLGEMISQKKEVEKELRR